MLLNAKLSYSVKLLSAYKLLVSLLYLCCGFLCSVSLPHGALGRSVVCNCDLTGRTRLLSEPKLSYRT